jgi:cupin fold WbuC family metalloprotein
MKLISATLLDELAAKAAASPRLRTHYNVHDGVADAVQRFFVVAAHDSYFRPHRHATKVETALVLRGRLELVTFDDTGAVVARHMIGEGAPSCGYETPQGTWHTLVVHSDIAAFYEVKQGPYDAATAAEFAAWSPPEGDAKARAYLDWARSAPQGARGPAP